MPAVLACYWVLCCHPRPSGRLVLVIKYCSEKSNSNADALLHNPVTQVPISENSCPVMCASKVKSHVALLRVLVMVLLLQSALSLVAKLKFQGTPSREPTRSVHMTEPKAQQAVALIMIHRVLVKIRRWSLTTLNM